MKEYYLNLQVVVGFNRTFMELKCDIGFEEITQSMYSFNRTFMELKLQYSFFATLNCKSFNRTFMELKWNRQAETN